MDMPTVFALYHAGTVARRLPEANTCHVHIVVLGETSPEVFTASGASMFCFVFSLLRLCNVHVCIFTCLCFGATYCRFTHMACCVRQYPSSSPCGKDVIFSCVFCCGLNNRTCSDHKAFSSLSLSVSLSENGMHQNGHDPRLQTRLYSETRYLTQNPCQLLLHCTKKST